MPIRVNDRWTEGAGVKLLGVTEPAPGCWEIDPERSFLEVSIRHALASRVKGRLAPLVGTVVVGEAPETSSVVASVPMASLNTGDSRRDEHLVRKEYLDVDRFPQAVFHSSAIRYLGVWRWQVEGHLTLRAVTAPMSLAVSCKNLVEVDGAQRARLVATAEVTRRSFGLTWNQVLEGGGLLLGPTLSVLAVIEARHVGLTGASAALHAGRLSE